MKTIEVIGWALMIPGYFQFMMGAVIVFRHIKESKAPEKRVVWAIDKPFLTQRTYDKDGNLVKEAHIEVGTQDGGSVQWRYKPPIEIEVKEQ